MSVKAMVSVPPTTDTDRRDRTSATTLLASPIKVSCSDSDTSSSSPSPAAESPANCSGSTLMVVSPSLITSPTPTSMGSRASVPLTKVPLLLPPSWTMSRPATTRSSQWLRERRGSPSRRPLHARPIGKRSATRICNGNRPGSLISTR